MKLIIGYLVALPLCVALAMWAGQSWTLRRWGDPGVTSMRAAGIICLIAALVAAIPVVAGSLRKSPSTGMLALAGTAIRLMVTIFLALAYQMLSPDLHMPSLMTWLPIIYLLVLMLETAMAVACVRRAMPPAGKGA